MKRMLICLVLACLLSPSIAGVSFNAIVDYSIHKANDMIRKMNKSTVDVSGLVDLPSEASNPRIYDLTSIRRIGNVTYETFDNGTWYADLAVQGTVGLNNLAFEADLEKKLLWIFTLTGGLRMQLSNNSLTLGTRLVYDQKGCSISQLNVTATLDGMNVDAWGMTIFGDYYVKEVVRDMYNKSKENWKSQIESQVKSKFFALLDEFLKNNPQVCHKTLSSMEEMDSLYEPFI